MCSRMTTGAFCPNITAFVFKYEVLPREADLLNHGVEITTKPGGVRLRLKKRPGDSYASLTGQRWEELPPGFVVIVNTVDSA